MRNRFPDQHPGIKPDTTYPLQGFMSISGLGQHAMREARARGLRVRYIGRRGFVFGGDFIEFMRSDAVKSVHTGKRPEANAEA